MCGQSCCTCGNDIVTTALAGIFMFPIILGVIIFVAKIFID
jgi:hypothetical protein